MKSTTKNTNKYTPQLIAEAKEEKLYFNIPLYQRLFAWGNNEVIGLLSDLKYFFTEEDDKESYYFGILSCVANGSKYDLIDGQQRFTLMMLLAIVLRSYDKRWETFLDKGRRLDFVARPHDKEFLRAEVNNDSISSEASNEKMINAISVIKNYLDKNFASDKEKEVFSANIYERLSFFFSKLPNEYMNEPSSLNKYFEAMNSSGKGLEQHEILKVKLLRGQNNQEWLTRLWNSVSEMSRPIIKKKEEDTQQTYREKYQKAIRLCQSGYFEESLNLCESSLDASDDICIGDIKAERRESNTYNGDKKERQTVVTFPEFLLMILDVTTSDIDGNYTFYRTELLKAVKDHPIVDVPSFYNTMLLYRLLLDYYVISWEKDFAGNRYNLISYNGSVWCEDVKQYESMLYVSQTPFYHWLKPLLEELAIKDIVDNKQVLAMLKGIDNNQHKLPKLDDLSYNKQPDRYWFWRLDYYLWENAKDYFTEQQTEVVRDYVFRANRSLEHLHPQHQVYNEQWDDEQDIHSFGNMAMISQRFNSQQSDDPVNVKFARIADQVTNHSLQSIKLYKMYLDAQCSPSGWTVDTMRIHAKKMYEILGKSFS